jgi:UDPglucose 6-dehydrogenase
MASYRSSALKIAIVGYGVVGKATHLGLLNSDPDVTINDININQYAESIIESQDLIFVCIPTGNQNEILVAINLCRCLAESNPNAEIVVRSTIPVSYIADLNNACGGRLIYCPEFLRERKWDTDCYIRPILIASSMADLKFFNIVPQEDCTRKSLEEIAIIKLMANVFNSVRITFANHVYEYCKVNNADFNQVISFINNQQRNGLQSYLEVSDDLRGFGGKCLPKDLKFCIDDFEKQNLDQTFFTGIEQDNTSWPTTIRNDQ